MPHPYLPALCVAAMLTADASLAWQAGVEGRLCVLDHAGPAGEVRLTYDPSLPLYSITIRANDPWPEAPFFGIAFLGGQDLTITTDRHQLSENGLSLTVTDSGFGNVLDGLAGNSSATMVAGSAIHEFSLVGAAPEVAAFRACATAPSA